MSYPGGSAVVQRLVLSLLGRGSMSLLGFCVCSLHGLSSAMLKLTDAPKFCIYTLQLVGTPSWVGPGPQDPESDKWLWMVALSYPKVVLLIFLIITWHLQACSKQHYIVFVQCQQRNLLQYWDCTVIHFFQNTGQQNLINNFYLGRFGGCFLAERFQVQGPRRAGPLVQRLHLQSDLWLYTKNIRV